MTEKKELPSVDQKLEELLETICAYCHCPHVEPTPQEALTGCCSACESCPIAGKVKELIALARMTEMVEFARMLATAHAETTAKIEARWKHDNG